MRREGHGCGSLWSEDQGRKSGDWRSSGGVIHLSVWPPWRVHVHQLLLELLLLCCFFIS